MYWLVTELNKLTALVVLIDDSLLWQFFPTRDRLKGILPYSKSMHAVKPAAFKSLSQLALIFFFILRDSSPKLFKQAKLCLILSMHNTLRICRTSLLQQKQPEQPRLSPRADLKAPVFHSAWSTWKKKCILVGNVSPNSLFLDSDQTPTAICVASTDTWWSTCCFTLCCSLTPPRRNRVTRIVSLENVSTDPACVTEDGSEISANTAKGDLSR